VEEGADLCLECGEPMGDSPVARAVRAETPSTEAQTQPIPKLDPIPAAPVAKPRARRVEDEPEPLRCPGCGVKTQRDRCPGCGAVLRRSDD
jgi:hypothetical protein